MKKNNQKSFQELIIILQRFWKNQGCAIIQPLDIEIGAGTYHPITYLTSLKQKNISLAYVQPSRRPNDGRYAKSLNKLQKHYQFQVIIKPSKNNIQKIYLKSLKKIGFHFQNNEIQFIEDNWENPTLGAWGVGWEVQLNGMEITQFTYFQQIGGIKCNPIITEITYGLERIAMIIQNTENIFDIIWSRNQKKYITYGELHKQNEIEQSKYNFEYSNIEILLKRFEEYEKETKFLLSLQKPLIFPAYESAIKASHIFNLLDSRKIFSEDERRSYISKIQHLTRKIAKKYIIS